MPNVELTCKPGVIRDATALASMGGYIDMDLARWSRGYLCPIGGWTKFANLQSFEGIARGAHAWVSLIGDPQLAWGTHAKLWAFPGSTYTDITPTDNAPTPGPVDGTGGSGYGAGSYGEGGYGAAYTSGFRAQTWTMANFGEYLIATFSGGATYAWEPYTVAAVDLVPNGGFASGTGWGLGTGWSITGGKAVATAGTASALSTTAPIAVTAGKTYRLGTDITPLTSGTLTPRIGVVDIGAAWSTAGTKSLLFVAPASGVLNLYKDAAFAGSVDNVSIKHEDKAYRIDQAPFKAAAMFVDIRGFVVLLGATEVDGDENPLNVRWCDRGNFREWIPDTDSLAGEVQLQGGSRLVGGLPTRGQNLIWSDTTLFSMQYAGSSPVFAINPVGANCGLIGPHAAAEADGVAFWMSNAGQFYMYNGAAPQVIDCPSRKFYFDDLAPGQDDKIYCWINAEHGEVWWSYASKRDGRECSRYIGYNWRENYWIDGELDRSSWVSGGIFSGPIGFSTDGKIYYHETGTSADGGILSGFATTGRMQIGKGDNLMTVTRVWPDIKDQIGAFSMEWTFYPSSQGPGTTYPPDMMPTGKQKVDFRRTGRQASVRYAWADYSVSFAVGKIGAEIAPNGARR